MMMKLSLAYGKTLKRIALIAVLILGCFFNATKAQDLFNLFGGGMAAFGLGNNTQDPSMKLHDEAMRYQEQGDYYTAVKYMEQAWEMVNYKADQLAQKQATNTEEGIVESFSVFANGVRIANDLSLLYIQLGEYDQAEFLLSNVIQIVEGVWGQDMFALSMTATFYNNLGLVYFNTGDYRRALQYYSQACTMNRYFYSNSGMFAMIPGIMNQIEWTYTTYLGNTGEAYGKLKEWNKAKEYLGQSKDRLKQIYEQVHDANSAEIYATALHNYGMILSMSGEVYQGQMANEEALKIIRSAYPQPHISWYSTLKGLGMIACQNKEYTKAYDYYQQALKINDTFMGENYMEHASIYNLIGELYCKQHQYSKAKTYLKSALPVVKNNYTKRVNYFTEGQRAMFWAKLQEEIIKLYPNYSYRAYPLDKSISCFAYEYELFTKGLLLTSSNAVRNSIMESGDTILIRKWDNLMAKKQQIMALEEKNPKLPYLSQLRDEAEQLEKEITRTSAAYRENMRQWNITWDSVRAALKPNQVAIEYMRAPLNKDSTMYCALLLRDTCTYPILIPLFEEKQVAQLLHTSRGDSVQINTTYQFKHHGEELSQLIWGPLQSYMHEGEEIFISPTHMLHQIAFEHLPYDEHRVMSDVYNIVRLSSTRELVIPELSIPHKKAVLYGGITYTGLEDEVMAYNKELYAKRSMNASTDSRCALTNYYATPLVGTQNEVDAIVPILKSKQIAVTIYSQSEACEESVKALSGQQQNILHFATHGMYVDTLTTSDPLERCMLTFAGANRALMGDTVPEGTDDGILTAKEISVLDFRKADIVVMSACETGLGDVSGEGVFGLQRAFKMAGAQTILMSLWQVHDDATQMLMTAFYRYYSKGMSKREAFRKAQQEVRNYTEKKTETYTIQPTQQEIMENHGKIVKPKTVTKTTIEHPYGSPYFWAGFILLD